jgi:uncharacterized membrane protein
MVTSHAGLRPRRFGVSPARVLVGLLVLLAAALYSTFELFRFYQFNSATYDLAIFDQAISSYAHFQPGISMVKGLHNGFGPHFSVLGDHFSPIIAVLAPLYWIHNAPQDLLVAQSVLFALAIPPLWIFTRRALGGGPRGTIAAYLVSVAYMLSWPIAAAAAFDFHEVAFVPVLSAVALERLQAGKTRTALLALGGLLLVKEDMGLMVAGFGVVLLVSRQCLNRQRLLGIGLIVAGLAATVLSVYVLIPAMGGRADYYFAYGAFGNNVPQALLHMAEHPLRALQELVTPRTKLDTMIWLFGAFAFLPLLSPITIAMVPLLLERMLSSTSSNWWGVQFQYNAFLVVILLLGAVDGGVRLGRWAVWARARWAGRVAVRSRARLAAGSAAAAGAGLATASVGAAGPPAGTTAAGTGAAGAAAARAAASIAAGLAASALPASTAPASTAPASTAPASTAPASTAPASTAPASTAPERTALERTALERTALERTAPARTVRSVAGSWRPSALTALRAAARPLHLDRAPELAGNIAVGAAGLLLAMAIMFVPKSDFGAMLHGGFYDLATPAIRAENAAVAAVPSGVTVATVNMIGPHLVARDNVVLWDGDGSTPPLLASWVVANTASVQYTFSSIAQEVSGRDGVRFLEHHGYRVVFYRLGYYVLHRGGLPAQRGRS